jgi:hypothetical protein
MACRLNAWGQDDLLALWLLAKRFISKMMDSRGGNKFAQI